MKKIEIAATVRNTPEGCLELFYYDERNDLVCYSMEEGHSYCDLGYMRSLTLASEERTKMMIEHYNAIDGEHSQVLMYPVKRLHSNRRYRWDLVS